jgi:hypothetical protein
LRAPVDLTQPTKQAPLRTPATKQPERVVVGFDVPASPALSRVPSSLSTCSLAKDSGDEGDDTRTFLFASPFTDDQALLLSPQALADHIERRESADSADSADSAGSTEFEFTPGASPTSVLPGLLTPASALGAKGVAAVVKEERDATNKGGLPPPTLVHWGGLGSTAEDGERSAASVKLAAASLGPKKVSQLSAHLVASAPPKQASPPVTPAPAQHKAAASPALARTHSGRAASHVAPASVPPDAAADRRAWSAALPDQQLGPAVFPPKAVTWNSLLPPVHVVRLAWGI